MKHIMTVVGARPQFIKASVLSSLINCEFEHQLKEILVHTGQHFDDTMSKVFFEDLHIPTPNYNLGIHSMTHGAMTGQMLEKLEEVMVKEKPDVAVVFGDTNSTLAGALAASKLQIPIAHIEAGERSYDEKMPEELNRKLTDSIASFLFCSSQTAVDNLKKEGINKNVFLVGDIMYDSFLKYKKIAARIETLEKFNLTRGSYVLLTLHRQETTENVDRLMKVLETIDEICFSHSIKCVFPVHPRTEKLLDHVKTKFRSIMFIEPVSYLDMINLEKKSIFILTDSGGIQKEAYWCSKKCITLRENTEWFETVQLGWNILSGLDPDRIFQAFNDSTKKEDPPYYLNLYGDGFAGYKIIQALLPLI